MNTLLEDIKRIEFDEIDYHKLSECYFQVVEGNIPILISAPHGARHLRPEIKAGKVVSVWKEEDEYTAALVIELGRLTEAHIIYVKNKTIEDSNFEEVTEYKRAVRDIIDKHGIKFLADIHGADEDNEFDVDVGIISERDTECSCPIMKPTIEECFKGFRKPLFNQKFSGASTGTVTYFASKVCGIEAAQFEINAKYRIVERKPDSSKALLNIRPDFKAEEKNVLKMLKKLEKMIIAIAKKAWTEEYATRRHYRGN